MESFHTTSHLAPQINGKATLRPPNGGTPLQLKTTCVELRTAGQIQPQVRHTSAKAQRPTKGKIYIVAEAASAPQLCILLASSN